MGASVYPVLEKEVPEFELGSMDGKALCRALPTEDDGSLLSPLLKFISISEEELVALTDDETFTDMEPSAQAHWFDASQCLEDVQHILSVLRASPESGSSSADEAKDSSKRLIRDLEGVERAMKIALQHHTRFRLCFDF